MNIKNLIMWVIIVMLSVGLFNMFQDPNKINSQNNTLSFSNFLDEVDNGRVVEVEIQGLTIQESFLVDENSIYEDTFIYVLEGNTAVRKKINIEGFVKDKVIITGKNLDNKKIILTRINNLNLFKKIDSKS